MAGKGSHVKVVSLTLGLVLVIPGHGELSNKTLSEAWKFMKAHGAF